MSQPVPIASGSPSKRVSCAECRRLKLKCSREWPCTACVRRGCADLCPDNVRPAEYRSAKAEMITSLLDKVKSLEAELSLTRGSQPSPTVVLAETVGALTLHADQERSTYHGPGYASALDHDSSGEEEGTLSFSPSPIALPFQSSGNVEHYRSMLPSRQDGTRYATAAYNGFISYEPLQRDVFERLHFPLAYSASPIHPHRLALIFAIFSCGSLNAIPDRIEASQRSHEYAGIAESILAGSRFTAQPTIASVQCLLVLCRIKGETEESYALGGLALRLAQATGLHRDPAAWSIELAEADQRRALWHEVLFLDTHSSLLLGRPCVTHIRALTWTAAAPI